jgi:hypothetical protein
MASTSEILINVVTLNKPKVLTGLPKREQSRYRSYLLSCRERCGSRRKGMDLPHSGIGTEHAKPISLPTLGKQLVREADRGVGTGRWRKRKLLCNGGDKG